MNFRVRIKPESRAVLYQVLETARRHGPSGVAVFDLDSTLFDNRPRQARIIREYGEVRGIPELAASRAEHWSSSWMVKEAIVEAGLSPERADEIFDDVLEFWRPRFFGGAYCLEDTPIAGAVDFVRRVHESGATVAYCTGRPDTMRASTVESLTHHGFPVPGNERVHLIMKPGQEVMDDDFKSKLGPPLLRALGSVVAAFDNEPTHINAYYENFPEAWVVHLATDHSGRPVQVHPAIPQIVDFVLP